MLSKTMMLTAVCCFIFITRLDEERYSQGDLFVIIKACSYTFFNSCFKILTR